MRRFNYGQNFQAINSSNFTWLTPLGTVEVAPGETMRGKFTTEVWSDTTNRPIMNRMYYDTFAFYIPYRLLWDRWVDFITEREEGLIEPGTTGTSRFFFESPVTTPDGCRAWNRRAYNLIFNKYFKAPFQPEVDQDNDIALRCPVRPTTFHEANSPDAQESVAVQVVDGSFTVDEFRIAAAQDRFDRARAYYGDKYVDYLMTLGVKTNWAINDEPELIGKAARDFVYHNTNATLTEQGDPTPDQFLGDSAGYFKTRVGCKIRNTFCPEHGLIFMVGVARGDILNYEGSVSPHLAKSGSAFYYSPQYESRSTLSWNTRIWGSGNNGTEYEVALPMYEEYRKPHNQVGQNNETTDKALLYFNTDEDATANPQNYSTPTEAQYAGMFTGTMGGSTQVQYCAINEVRMLKTSPIKPSAAKPPIS